MIHASNRKKWRTWLKKNHTEEREVWLVYYKKHTAKLSVSYPDSVEEALCFGWIDGIKNSLGEQEYSHRFTPRKTGSEWSPLNIRLAQKMIEEGKMTPAGLTRFNQRVEYDKEILTPKSKKNISLTPETTKGLKSNKKAWENFNNLSPSQKKLHIGWIQSAKKQETRERRLKEVIKHLVGNKKLGIK